MKLQIQHIIPVPLKDVLLKKNSDVWNKDCVFNQSERIKIKAPSGTGKTTFVHILYKLRNDFEGSVLYDDKNYVDIVNDELANIRQHKISIVFQDLRLFPNLTAFENIELKRIMQESFYEKGKIFEMADILGVSHIMQQQCGLCSYGEQQRIAIIRALIQPFEWLLMDEPFSHLDEKNTAKAAALIADECTKRNAGFIITDLDDDKNFDYSRKMNL